MSEGVNSGLPGTSSQEPTDKRVTWKPPTTSPSAGMRASESPLIMGPSPDGSYGMRPRIQQTEQEAAARQKAEEAVRWAWGNTTYAKFLKENPFARTQIEMIHDAGSPEKVRKTATDGRLMQEFDIIHAVSPMGSPDQICGVSAADKDQDALAVSKLPDGTINIAVADGVSGCVLPSYASREAVKVATAAMAAAGDIRSALHAAHNTINSPSLGPTAEEQVNYWGKLAQANPTGANRAAQRITSELLYERRKVSNTMLTVAQYDRPKGVVRIAGKGDTAALVFQKDGCQVFQGEEQDEIGYGIPYNPNTEKYAEVPLEDGDVVVLCTDGALGYPDVINQLHQYLTIARQNNVPRLDYQATLFLRFLMRAQGIGDDVVFVALAHSSPQ